MADELAKMTPQLRDALAGVGTASALSNAQYDVLDQLLVDAYGPGAPPFPRASGGGAGQAPTGGIVGINTGGDPLVVLSYDFADPDGDGTDVLVDWGDGSTPQTYAYNDDPSYTYTANGSYTVTVTARDAAGNETTDSAPVTISGVSTGPDVTLDFTNDATPSGNAPSADGSWVFQIEPSLTGSWIFLIRDQSAGTGSFVRVLMDIASGDQRVRVETRDNAGTTVTQESQKADAANGGTSPDFDFQDRPTLTISAVGGNVAITLDGHATINATYATPTPVPVAYATLANSGGHVSSGTFTAA